MLKVINRVVDDGNQEVNLRGKTGSISGLQKAKSALEENVSGLLIQ
jgi:hypothetical protein